MRRIIVIAALAAVVVGCATTKKAESAVNARFVGQPSDSFFARYGAPLSSFPLNNGGAVYRWRGGETFKQRLDDNKQAPPIASGGGSTSSTTTTTTNPAPGRTVTESTTTSFGGSFVVPQQIIVPPKPPIPIYCEADVSVDAQGVITGFHVSADTEGVGFSMSRCAEVFDVQ